MTSPVGHTLAGLVTGGGATGGRFDWRWLLLLVFSANAADLDFVPGMLLGDANRFHHLATHSLAAALLYALLLALLASRFGMPVLKTALFAGFAYASHLLLDYFTVDAGEPFGMLLWWPLSDLFYISDTPFFQPVEHGNFGDGNLKVISLFLSPVNLLAVVIEVAVLAPAVVLSWWWSARRRKLTPLSGTAQGRPGKIA